MAHHETSISHSIPVDLDRSRVPFLDGSEVGAKPAGARALSPIGVAVP